MPENDDPPIDPVAIQRRWVQSLDAAEKDCRTFVDDGKRVVERYRNESKIGGKNRRAGMPILYSNTDQLASALYQKAAKPDVRRRFSDRDPAGQATAEMIERALIYFDDVGAVDSAIKAAIQDYLLPGRGAVRIEYEPILDKRQQTDPVTGQPLFVTDDAGNPTDEPATVDFLADQKVHHHYVFWQDLLVSPARRWPDVSWIAFRHVMDRNALEKQIYDNAGPQSQVFGSPDKIPLDWQPDLGDKIRTVDQTLRQAEVWEIWDKPGAQRIWIAKSAMQPLRIDPDPYGLDGFFPMPEPLAAYRTSDTVTPQALYKAYEHQAEELDEAYRRVAVLTRALKRRGVYDQSIPELKRLASANDNEYIGVANYGALSQKGGLAASMQTEDISVIAAVILQLRQSMGEQIQAIYEISAISDIMRGSTDPNETLGAQQLKAQNGSIRLKKMQRDVQIFVRDLNRIKVDLLCQHFEPNILQQITNMQVTPEIMATLQSDAMRGYRVDIETDSTVFQDALALQQERSGYIKGMVDLLTGMGPIVQQRPEAAPLMFEMMKFGAAAFHDARPLQDAIDELAAKIQNMPPQPQGGAPQDPAAQANAQAAQAKAQAAQVKAQSDAQQAQTAIQVAQIQAQGVATKAQAEVQRTALQIQADRESHAQDMTHADAAHQQAVAQAAQQHDIAVRTAMLRGQNNGNAS